MDYASRNLKDTALIVITGHASTESAIEAIHQHVSDYITKPFDFDLLIASIEKAFAQIEARRLREDMIRMISHDIRVPLNSIMGFAQFIIDPSTGEASNKAKEYVEKILLNSQRILGLVDNYLTHAKAESGRLEILPQPMQIEETVEEAVRLLAGEFDRKEISLETDTRPLGVQYKGEEPLLFRAVANLLNNAVKYTPRGGTVRVWIEKRDLGEKGPGVVISVANNGPAIPEEEFPMIFEKFRRTTTSAGMEGSGLGLFVVREVAKAHEGWAECESGAGKDTTFRIVLPLMHEAGI
jgi:signal transduction histidine kinase